MKLITLSRVDIGRLFAGFFSPKVFARPAQTHSFINWKKRRAEEEARHKWSLTPRNKTYSF
jgi:hypothetical protein